MTQKKPQHSPSHPGFFSGGLLRATPTVAFSLFLSQQSRYHPRVPTSTGDQDNQPAAATNIQREYGETLLCPLLHPNSNPTSTPTPTLACRRFDFLLAFPNALGRRMVLGDGRSLLGRPAHGAVDEQPPPVRRAGQFGRREEGDVHPRPHVFHGLARRGRQQERPDPMSTCEPLLLSCYKYRDAAKRSSAYMACVA